MDGYTRASCKVAQIIAKSSRPFSDCDFVRECIQGICSEVCPKKASLFSKVPLSRMTIQRRIQDLAQDVTKQLRERLAVCRYFSIAFNG